MSTLVAGSGSETAAEPAPRRGSLGRYVVGKVLGALGSLLFVLVVNFFLFRVLPGDPARTLTRGRAVSADQLDAIREQYGLDEPLPRQFLTFLTNTFQGDLGVSIRYNVPVSELIADRMWPTIALVGVSTLLATVIGVYLGMVSACGAAAASTSSRPAPRSPSTRCRSGGWASC